MNDREPLDAVEARILGVLIEKELTTPAQYPLSLNAVSTGCNQKSNREPVLTLTEPEVRQGLERLQMKQLAGGASGSRVARFRHNAREVWSVSAAGLAILAELLMRGAQSPGDLRARASRMHNIPTQGDLAVELDALIARGYVARLEPLPGTRTQRYDQLLALRERRPRSLAERAANAERTQAPTHEVSAAPGSHAEAPGDTAANTTSAAAVRPHDASEPDALGTVHSERPMRDRVAHLERQVERLSAELRRLAQSLGEEL